MLSADAIVIRDGKETKVPAKELVPGDVVILNTGDRVPGDIRMLEVNNLSSLEAALTGESVPIEKSTDAIIIPGQDPRQTPLGDRKNMCFSATLISQGYAVGIVASTGDYTEIGTINKLVNNSEEKQTAVLEQIAFIAKVLAAFISIVAAITFTVTVVQIDASYTDALTIALTCAVAMIPEGLEAIVTMTYSWSVATLAKHNAIVRVLPSVETLGSVTTICSDKTGTLTKNEMSLVAYVTSNAHYKFDVDSKKRTAVNFRREDAYLTERTAHALKKSAKCVIQSGPSASRGTGDRGKSDFGFSIHGASGHSEFSQGEDVPEDTGASKVSDPTPVSNGDSPSLSFIRNALAGGVLCSKCTLGKEGDREGKISLL